MESKFNVKTVIGIFIGIVFVAVLQQYVLPSFFKPSIDSEMIKIASEMNKNCPMMVDAETRWDNTSIGPGKTLVYNYTLINYNKTDIDTNLFRSAFNPQIRNTIKTNPEMKYLRDENVTFIYNYKDKSSIHITQIKVFPKDYKD